MNFIGILKLVLIFLQHKICIIVDLFSISFFNVWYLIIKMDQQSNFLLTSVWFLLYNFLNRNVLIFKVLWPHITTICVEHHLFIYIHKIKDIELLTNCAFPCFSTKLNCSYSQFKWRKHGPFFYFVMSSN